MGTEAIMRAFLRPKMSDRKPAIRAPKNEPADIDAVIYYCPVIVTAAH